MLCTFREGATVAYYVHSGKRTPADSSATKKLFGGLIKNIRGVATSEIGFDLVH
jgi:hypothetical protein